THTSTPEIYTLSLHDALPILLNAERHEVGDLVDRVAGAFGRAQVWIELQRHLHDEDPSAVQSLIDLSAAFHVPLMASNGVRFARSEEHTSELQSLTNLVCRLL